MMCRVVGANTSFQIVMHWQLQPTFFQRSYVVNTEKSNSEHMGNNQLNIQPPKDKQEQ